MPLPPLPRHWRTMRGDTPGVDRHCCRAWARVSVRGRWVRIKSCDTENEATRIGRLARRLDQADLIRLAAMRLSRRLRWMLRTLQQHYPPDPDGTLGSFR